MSVKFLTEGNVMAVAVPSGQTWTVDDAKLIGDVLGIVEATNNQTTITTAVGDNGDIATMRLNGVINGLPKSTGTGSGGAQLAKAYWDVADEEITALSTEGAIASIAVTAGGTGYTSAPTVGFTGGEGSGATATAAIAKKVASISIGAGGSSYSTAPTVVFTGGGGTGAAGTAVLTANAVTSITITNAGTGYTSAPTISFTGGGGTGATATATMTGYVSAITVTDGGGEFTSAPTISFTGGAGSGATATATVSSSVHIGSFWESCEDEDETCTVKLKIG